MYIRNGTVISFGLRPVIKECSGVIVGSYIVHALPRMEFAFPIPYRQFVIWTDPADYGKVYCLGQDLWSGS